MNHKRIIGQFVKIDKLTNDFLYKIKMFTTFACSFLMNINFQ